MKSRWWHTLKLLILALLLLAAAGGVIFHRQLLVAAAEYLITEEPLQKADAILVLSGDVPERILEAVDLFKAGSAPRILLTKEEELEHLDRLRALGVPSLEAHEINQLIAGKSGIPPHALVVLEPRVDSTYREAQVAVDYCLRQQFRTIILVTSKPHTTRAAKIFHHLAAGRLRIISRPSRYDTFDPASWWRSRIMQKEVLLEYEKLAHYYLVVLTGG
jgi:uncharacterized SAM-binding protein YcdF (DUF218 family)